MSLLQKFYFNEVSDGFKFKASDEIKLQIVANLPEVRSFSRSDATAFVWICRQRQTKSFINMLFLPPHCKISRGKKTSCCIRFSSTLSHVECFCNFQ